MLHENQSAGGGPTRRRATRCSEDDLRLSRTPESARGLRGASLKEDDVEAIPSNRRLRAGALLLDIRNRLPPMAEPRPSTEPKATRHERFCDDPCCRSRSWLHSTYSQEPVCL